MENELMCAVTMPQSKKPRKIELHERAGRDDLRRSGVERIPVRVDKGRPGSQIGFVICCLERE